MDSSGPCQEGISEIIFFDLETTAPNRAGQRFWVLEFGAIVVCPRKLVEIESFSALIRPMDLSAVALKSGRSDGITQEAVANAPAFADVAEKIFSILNGRIWAGHNIQRFDCVRIKEAFAEIGKPAPVPVGMIDSLRVLTEKFGRRAGNLKVPEYLYILLPTLLNAKWNNSTITTRSRSNEKLLCREETSRKSPPTTLGYQRTVPYARGSLGKRFYFELLQVNGVKNLMCNAQETRYLNKLLNILNLC
ncbi:hypothetical protein P3X46_018443 [Hevea brasiliensis]|uniref:Exonuclease domain-containing protein n=1 Tax=Hevea brasiliensis TaxID=3981 RepID=A0ABQ9LQQ2_HEVBR|nr:hypothetical protein P3X46_018443 [Hevea brasiliensis]